MSSPAPASSSASPAAPSAPASSSASPAAPSARAGHFLDECLITGLAGRNHPRTKDSISPASLAARKSRVAQTARLASEKYESERRASAKNPKHRLNLEAFRKKAYRVADASAQLAGLLVDLGAAAEKIDRPDIAEKVGYYCGELRRFVPYMECRACSDSDDSDSESSVAY